LVQGRLVPGSSGAVTAVDVDQGGDGEYLEAGTAAQFLPRDLLVARLERLAANLPVRTGVDVLSVRPALNGYRVQTSTGPLRARVVVAAGGGQRIPTIPPFAQG
jgi:cation diffusion facilitator CzcD-associated flavoprotein CzcO